MATLIDALVVTLGLDGSKFRKGAEDAEKTRKRLDDQSKRSDADQSKREKKLAEEQAKRAKQTEDAAKRMAQGINKVRNEALALFAVFTAGVGLKNFFANTIDSAAALGQQAANLDMSTEKLSAWQRANERAGGTAAGMTAQLKESADSIAKYKLGQGMDGGLQKFFQYGGSDTALKDGNTYLLARAKIISDLYAQDPNKAHLLSGQMGISEEQFNLIKQGPAAILALVAAQEKNSVITAKDAAEALKLKNQMLDLRDRLESVATRIVLQLAPSLEKLMLKFQAMAEWIASHGDDITKWVDSAIAGLTKFIGVVDDVAQSIGGWKNVLIGLIALKVTAFAAEMVVLASSIASVATSLGLVGKLGWVIKALGPLSLLFHSGGAGEGEDEALKKRRANTPGYDANGNLASAPAGGNTPRGMRNNNPGNIEYGKFALKHGATGSDGRFAKFPTMEAGQSAMQALLSGYMASGQNTVGKIIAKWAPNGENNTAAYINAVAKKIGVGPDQALLSSHIPLLAEAMSRHENGAAWNARNAMAAVNMPTGAAAARRQAGGSTRSSSSDVRINTINVNTQATDAAGIAKGIGSAVQNNGLIAQANGGLN